MVYAPLGSHHHKYFIRQSACVTIVVCSNLIAIMDGGRELQHQLLIMSEINDRRWTPFPMAAAETTTYYWLGVMCRQYIRWRRGITIDCIAYAADSRRRSGCFVILLLWIPTRANTRLNCSDTIHMYFKWYRGMYMYFCTSTLPTWVPPRRTRRNVPENGSLPLKHMKSDT